MPEHSRGAGISVYPFLDSYPCLEASVFHFLEADSARILGWNSSHEILNAYMSNLSYFPFLIGGEKYCVFLRFSS